MTWQLKQRLVALCVDFEQTTVDKAINQWREPLRAYVMAKNNTLSHADLRCRALFDQTLSLQSILAVSY